MRPKPTVGQTLYALNINNNARNQPQELRPVKVISVGRKYFKTLPDLYADRPHMAVEYTLEDWTERTQYSPDWKLYASEGEWVDQRDAEMMTSDIVRAFSGFGRTAFPIKALRIAHAALFPTSTLGGGR